MKKIKLTQGKFALVDDEDFEELNKHTWYARKSAYNTYAARSQRVDGRVATIRMHRFIMKITSKKLEVHHNNENTFDNQKSNLLVCTKQYNLSKRRKYSHE